MLRTVFRIRNLGLLAIVGSLFGALLMFLIGSVEVVEAFLLFFRIGHALVPGQETREAIATVLSSLDSFLLGFIMLYFAFGLFKLLSLSVSEYWKERVGEIQIPPHLEFNTLEDMKLAILTVIVVSLSVDMLKEALVRVEPVELSDLFLPVAIVSVALSIRLIRSADRSDKDDEEEK